MVLTKGQILDALHAFVRQRPGLDAANYGTRATYEGDCRRVRQQLHDFERLLAAVDSTSEIGVPELMAACRAAYRGRLSLSVSADGGCTVSYQAGQYYPTEYRAAACAVLAQALWDAARTRYVSQSQHANDGLRAYFRRKFGAGLQRRWFD